MARDGPRSHYSSWVISASHGGRGGWLGSASDVCSLPLTMMVILSKHAQDTILVFVVMGMIVMMIVM